MTEQTLDNLEQRIGQLTEWDGDSPQEWKAALKQTDAASAIQSHWSWRRIVAVAALVVITLTVVTAALLPATGRARDNAQLSYSDDMDQYAQTDTDSTPSTGAIDDKRGLAEFDPVPSSEAAQRHVVRKATIELVTDDARGTFLKASMLISEAHGEFIEESSMAGGDDVRNATIVLRVSVSRLSAVMNELRALGEVREESLRGDDVTSQVVDIGARLRNEQRIETELLELLETRTNAPLDDVLQVRRELQNVRQRIEQLTAQRDQLSRLVSLATILVLIQKHDGPAQEEVAEPSFGSYFSDSIGEAWSDGLHSLVNALSFLIKIIIGGIIWWAIAVASIIAAWRLFRRHQTQATA